MTTETTQATLRPLLADDATTVAEIFRDAVLNGTTAHYTETEREAWAGPKPDPERWRDRVGSSVGLMAERDGTPLGLMTLVAPGHIDLAFVRPSAAGQGIGAELLAALTQIARASGARELTAEVSKAARPFFERHGFYVLRQQSVIRRGVALINYAMQKPL
ncbi:GNAT family N-acetyltransferase [Salipiger bermudensis]|uniref:GCN5-related N-acetyltransferase n=1 Tax=Salipiger bermudensis (strain DSM 26914 / JCM 13377 / KCTC 12554 / HTCC2601) TaxID=314265 RepID=Q0FJI9_SALBH|nr:GNAT family N-acetyltransferase [Salipiger bermudensis]EAU44369.1 GCN5-related N-acetyltransferase [Salipiger bermudensis HTCC2601]